METWSNKYREGDRRGGPGVQEMKRGIERMGEERERVNERESSVPWSRRKNL